MSIFSSVSFATLTGNAEKMYEQWLKLIMCNELSDETEAKSKESISECHDHWVVVFSMNISNEITLLLCEWNTVFCELRRDAEEVKHQVLSDLDILCKSLWKNNVQRFIRKHHEDALKDLLHQVSLTQCIVVSVTDHDITRIMYELKAEALIFTDTGQVRLFKHI